MAKTALENTTDILLRELEDIIQRNVYDVYSPIWYERTNELKDNWERTKAEIKYNMVENEIAFTKPLTYSGAYNYSHGFSHLDNNAFLEVVNEGKIGNWCNVPQLGAREFWEEWLQYCEQNFDRIFNEEMNKL
ncbi:MAG: hypothetical protein KBT03_03675 [Bacteroidales bacterium]|nr:hypothetical protein [Candidatus Scybalousia scybalohippi]